MTQPVLSIRDLSVSFTSSDANPGSRNRAVNNLDLDLFPGKLTALVGESGSGKSVSAMSILGLVPAPPARLDSGSIVYRDSSGTTTDLTKASNRELRSIRGSEIAMIFQEPMTSLNPVLMIGSQIIEAVRLHRTVSKKTARKIAIDSLDRVGIPDPAARLSQYPHEFSGGMRQRVMISIALACEPRVLIADEPTTALDVTIQATILELIRTLVERDGLSVLLITHDLALVSQYADRVAVMYRGYLLESGIADAVLSQPVHPYTRGLLATAPEIGIKRDRLATLESFLDDKASDSQPSNASPRPWTPPATGQQESSHSLVSIGDDHLVRVKPASV